jgi:hypothetical protein
MEDYRHYSIIFLNQCLKKIFCWNYDMLYVYLLEWLCNEVMMIIQFPEIVPLLSNSSQMETSLDFCLNTPVTEESAFITPVQIPPVDSTPLFSFTTINATLDGEHFPQVCYILIRS